MRYTLLRRYVLQRSVVASGHATFPSYHDRRAQAEAAGRSRALEPRDQLRASEGDREGARPRRPAGELGIQSGARATAVRPGARLAFAAAPLQALKRERRRYPARPRGVRLAGRSEEHTSELQSLTNLVCRLLLEKKNKT